MRAKRGSGAKPAMGGERASEFRPVLRNVSGNIWTASLTMPVVGRVTCEGDGWSQAKLRLWMVVEAVKHAAAQTCKDPREWSDAEWRATLGTMMGVMQPNEKGKGGRHGMES